MKVTTQQAPALAFVPFEVTLRIESKAEAEALFLLGQANLRVPQAVCGYSGAPAYIATYRGLVQDICSALFLQIRDNKDYCPWR